MRAQRLWIGVLVLVSMSLVEVMGNEACGKEILVKGVPYITQKAHID